MGGKGGVGVVIVWQVDELEVAAMMLRLGKRGRWSCGRASRTFCSSVDVTYTHKTQNNLTLLPQFPESPLRALTEPQRHSTSCETWAQHGRQETRPLPVKIALTVKITAATAQKTGCRRANLGRRP